MVYLSVSLSTMAGVCLADSYVRCGLVWDRSSKEVCVLHLDGTVAFYSVRVEEGVHLFTGIGKPIRSESLGSGIHISIIV